MPSATCWPISSKARKRWHEDGDKHAFSLTAVTGAGKTVMAAAVFEALFHGDDELRLRRRPRRGGDLVQRRPVAERADPLPPDGGLRPTRGTPIWWWWKTPSTARKLRGRKDLLPQHPEAGQEQPAGARLRCDDEDGGHCSAETRPDLRSHTIWDTIRNTIEDPALTLYLVLDEAHRGMGNPSSRAERQDHHRASGSSTARGACRAFRWCGASPPRSSGSTRRWKARRGAPHCRTWWWTRRRCRSPGCSRTPSSSTFPTRRAISTPCWCAAPPTSSRDSTDAWASLRRAAGRRRNRCCRSWSLQVPNTPNHNDIGARAGHDLPAVAGPAERRVAHVFGEHTTQTFGRHYGALHLAGARAGRNLGAGPDRQGRHQHRLGLPARRGDGVLPARDGPHPHHAAAGPHGAHARWRAASPATTGSTRWIACCRCSTRRRSRRWSMR